VRAYFGLRKLKEPRAFFSWLLGIASRVVKENHRAETRRGPTVALSSDPADTATGEDDSRDYPIAWAVAELPEVYRHVVLLRYYAGMSCAQISRDLDVPLGTVTKRLSRAYSLLRKSLREPKELPDNEKYARMTPKETARAFFDACAQEDWEEFGKFMSVPPDDRIKKILGGLEVIRIGEPFKSGGYGGWFVPYEIKFKGSSGVRKHNLAVRNDNPAKRYVVDGGI
jgi:RNA polymerase sigma factor (sigma-70 family)